jgi:hypothetical protein
MISTAMKEWPSSFPSYSPVENGRDKICNSLHLLTVGSTRKPPRVYWQRRLPLPIAENKSKKIYFGQNGLLKA